MTITDYAEALQDHRVDVILGLDALIRKAAPNVTGSIKWAQPVWDHKGPVAYAKAAANHVTFGFWRGTELADPDGLLEGTGDRMKHIKLGSSADIDEAQLTAWVNQAVALNEAKGSPTKREA